MLAMLASVQPRYADRQPFEQDSGSCRCTSRIAWCSCTPRGSRRGASHTGFDDTSLSFQVYQQLRAERAAFAELMAYVPPMIALRSE